MKTIPDSPGVYLLYNKKKEVIYVGKAISLKKRLSSYFSSKDTDIKTAYLKDELVDFDFILAPTEIDSLLLEANLIKKYKPKYNIKLKDDKSYPYLKVTLSEEFPRFIITRKFEEDKSRYFGPYSGTKSLKTTIRLLKQFFPVASCRKKNIRKKACLNFHIGKCAAPCIGGIDKQKYKRIVKSAISLLEGRIEEVIENLKKEMKFASDNLEFERAALLRDKINALKEMNQRQTVLFTDNRNVDVIAGIDKENLFSTTVLYIRNGKLWGKDNYILNSPFQSDKKEIISSFLLQYYNEMKFIPDEILIEVGVENGIRNSLRKLAHNKEVFIKIPSTDEEYNIIEMAKKNAMQKLSTIAEGEKAEYQLACEELKKLIGKSPELIAAIDASNIFGKYSVAGIVVFKSGSPNKDMYRKFKINNVGATLNGHPIPISPPFLKGDEGGLSNGHDDTARIHEVATRYFKRIKEGKESELDLIIIDGGKGQLNAAVKAAKESDIEIPIQQNVAAGFSLRNLSIISYAKNSQTIYYSSPENGEIKEYKCKKEETLNFITRIISEVHRFSITYHRKKRSEWLNLE